MINYTIGPLGFFDDIITTAIKSYLACIEFSLCTYTYLFLFVSILLNNDDKIRWKII